jgi:hypothetical protein
MKSKILKTGLISLIALISFNCGPAFQAPAAVFQDHNVVQFSKIQKPAKMGDLNSFSLVDPKYGTIVCFQADKAKKLRLYIDQYDEALDKANATIDNANTYIKQLNK